MSQDNKTLKVGFDIGNEPAKQAVTEIKLDLANLEALVAQAAANMEAGQKRGMASMRRAIAAQTAAQEKMFRELIERSQQAAQKQENLGSALMKTGIAMAGISQGVKYLQMYAEAVKEASEYQHKLSEDLERQIEMQGELAAIQGKSANVKFALDVVKSAKQAGMTPEEMTKFQTEMANSGAQFIGQGVGKTMTESQAKKFAVDSAKLATARGLPAEVVGDLAGRLVGQHDFAGMGEQAGVDEATGRLGRVMAILSAGSGSNAGLLKQQTQTMAALMHEDKLKGVFRSPEDVAKFVSTMAEQNPEEAYTHIKSMQRLIFAKDGSEAVLKRKAGITANDDIPTAAQKLAPVVAEEAKKRNVPIQEVLAKYIPEIKEQEALATVLNRGVGDAGVLKQREEAIKGVDATSVRKEFDEAAKDPNSRVAKRVRDAERKEAEAEIGAKRMPYEALAQQAETNLIKRGEINTTWDNFTSKAYDYSLGNISALTRGVKGAKAAHIDDEIARMLEQKNAEAGGVLPQQQIEDIRSGVGEQANEARIMAAYDALNKAGQQLGKVAEKMEAAAPAAAAPKTMTKATPGGGKAMTNR